ncbi:hypothetical protein [Nonomuraea sp. NPDC050202]|uniref:hypothetical protein n=1 Tax=Nonomuraea sp. NPDC050202 TaxID=3155035 RepID=UPI00340857FF
MTDEPEATTPPADAQRDTTPATEAREDSAPAADEPEPKPEPEPKSEPEPEPESEDAPPGGPDAGAAAGGEPPSRGRRFTRAKVVGALAAMLVTAITATAVLQWISAAQAEDARAGLESERALRLEVSGAASAFSRALLSYDYQNLQSTRSTLAAQATGDFLTTYDAAFGGAMTQVIVKLKATSQATVREVYLADVDEATAHAIVVVDQQVNTSEAIRSVKDSHLKISLVKEKGTWKIHDVTVLGAASEDQYNLNGDDKKKD